MTLLAGRLTDSDVAPFLMVWGLGALAIGGTLATRKWSIRFHAFMVSNFDGRPESQRQVARMPAGLLRLMGGFFVVVGAIVLPTSVVVITRS